MIRHGLITELRIIGASEAANLIIDMKAQLEKERTDLAAARAEIERLNGRRCDICKHGTPYYGPDQMKVKSAIWCHVNSGVDERVSRRFEFGDHYCKNFEKR